MSGLPTVGTVPRLSWRGRHDSVVANLSREGLQDTLRLGTLYRDVSTSSRKVRLRFNLHWEGWSSPGERKWCWCLNVFLCLLRPIPLTLVVKRLRHPFRFGRKGSLFTDLGGDTVYVFTSNHGLVFLTLLFNREVSLGLFLSRPISLFWVWPDRVSGVGTGVVDSQTWSRNLLPTH